MTVTATREDAITRLGASFKRVQVALRRLKGRETHRPGSPSFAQYQLLNSGKNLAVRSHKVGFCIAPTDPVDLVPPTSVWQPSFLGFGGERVSEGERAVIQRISQALEIQRA